jgi:hypothetical protein
VLRAPDFGPSRGNIRDFAGGGTFLGVIFGCFFGQTPRFPNLPFLGGFWPFLADFGLGPPFFQKPAILGGGPAGRFEDFGPPSASFQSPAARRPPRRPLDRVNGFVIELDRLPHVRCCSQLRAKLGCFPNNVGAVT